MEEDSEQSGEPKPKVNLNQMDQQLTLDGPTPWFWSVTSLPAPFVEGYVPHEHLGRLPAFVDIFIMSCQFVIFAVFLLIFSS